MSTRTATNVSEHVNLAIASPKDPVKLVRERYDLSKRLSEQRRNQYLEIYQLYQGYVDPSKRVRGRANFHYHHLFPQIETESSRYLTSYFAHNPYVQVQPCDTQYVEAAKAREQIMQYYFEHSPSHFYETWRFFKYCNLYGWAWRMPTWRHKRGIVKKRLTLATGQDVQVEMEQVLYDGLWFQTFSPLEVFLHPYARSVQQLPWIIIEEFIHVDELVKRAQQGEFDLDAVMKIPLNTDGQEDMAYKLLQSRIGESQAEADPEIIRLLHSFAPDRFITSANDAVAIRDDSNWLNHGQIPGVMGVRTLDPESIYPIGSAKPIVPNQKMTNFVVNNMINQMVRHMDPVWWRRSRNGPDPRNLVSRPNHVIDSEGAFQTDFGLIEFPEFKHDLLLFKNMLTESTEETSGFHAAQKGYSRQANTATSDSIFQEEGNIRINADVMAFEECTMIPEAKQCAALIEQFMPHDVAVRLSGPKGQEFLHRTPEDIAGEFDYRVAGISETINRAVQQQQLIELFNLGAGANQLVQMPNGQLVPMPVLNVYEYLKAILEPTARKSTDKLLFAPELFGLPVDNQLFTDQYNLAPLPGLESRGGGPMVPRMASSLRSATTPGGVASAPVRNALEIN